MRKLIFLPAALLAGAVLSTAALAHEGSGPDGEGWGHHRHGEAMMVLKQLNLSDSQKASVKELFKTSRQQLRPQFEAVRSQRQAFNAATPGSPEFQNAAASLAQAESAAVSARVQQQTVLRTQIYNLLTDEQKAQFKTLQAQHLARMAEWQAQHAQDHAAD